MVDPQVLSAVQWVIATTPFRTPIATARAASRLHYVYEDESVIEPRVS